MTDVAGEPWLIKHPELVGAKLYIFVFYWVVEIITTVGYGDFAGGTTVEYLITVIIEFGGLIVFTVLMLLMNQLIDSGFSYEQLVTENLWALECWIVKVERSNQPCSIDPVRFLGIRKNLEDAFLYDFNVIIEAFDFYEQLSP